MPLYGTAKIIWPSWKIILDIRDYLGVLLKMKGGLEMETHRYFVSFYSERLGWMPLGTYYAASEREAEIEARRESDKAGLHVPHKAERDDYK